MAFKEASNVVSRLVNSLKPEEVRWSEVNIKAMVLKSGRASACSEEEDEETRASIKGTRKGRVGGNLRSEKGGGKPLSETFLVRFTDKAVQL